MKKYIVIIMTLISGAAFAAGSMFDGMSKEQLANYEIQIVDKTTGKIVGKMSRAEYKVVRIGSSAETELPANVQASVERLKNRIVEDQKIANKYREGYNTVIIHAGAGNDGLSVDHSNGQYSVYEKVRAVGGLTGCRSTEGTGICASAFTNETYTLGLKLDF